MKTLILTQPFSFQFIETEHEPNLNTDEALVKIHKIGICGTDYHAYVGKQPFFNYPRVLGHELGAEVVKIGSNTLGISIGDKVSIEPYLNCEKCQPCRNGKHNCCENLQVLGVHKDGGMTEYLKVPIKKLHRSNTLHYEQLALVETLSIGAHAVQRAEVSAKDLVLVIGAGPIGLSVIQFCKLAGAQIAVLDLNTNRLKFAQTAFDTDISIELTPDFTPEMLRRYLNGHLPTVVFDATGNSDSMNNAFHYVAFGGKLIFVGLFIGDITFHDPLFHRREMTLFASRNSMASDFKNIIQLMEKGKIDTSAWLSHRADFDALPNIFNHWLAPSAGVIKAIVSL